ncbi:TonB-dependent receptor [Hymenobacter sediminicola]|uniref:TonB-dependent receptor n=1 Tax=Hymenobacter sediminicola TaxID=2761579 RepID=A0A7G7WAR8_9BACT|nr:TonB-dependent receptor [Hymenobacter sediminicola]QNH63461.1 TonB-dependent receptor [Hymenobacter sediminicola]
MKRLLLVLLLLAPMLGLRAQTPTLLHGTIHDGQGQPLPGANVFLRGTFDGTATDSLGAFRLETTQAGAQVLVLSLLGYEPQNLPIQCSGQPLKLQLKMKADRHQLGGVTIMAGAFEASDEKRGAVLKPLDIVTTAGALGDVAGALNALPGTTRVGEEGKLFVRGGAAHETKTYLDGLAVQTPYNGSVPSVPARGRFSPFLFKGTVFSTGGYSAEYGQALSAVVLLNTTDLAPETQTGVSVMSVGGSLSQVQRWERTSVAVTADYVNLQPYFGLVPQSFGWVKAPQTLGSSVSLRHRTGEAGMLKVYGVWQQQRLSLRQPNEQLSADRTVGLHNGNGYLNATFRSPLRGGWSLQTGAAFTRDDNTVRPDAARLQELEQSIIGRVVLTNDSAGTNWTLKVGAEGMGQQYRRTYQETSGAPTWNAGRFTERRTAAFAEADISLSDRLMARAGARAEYSGLLNRWNAAPRLALAWQTGANSSVSGAYGLFYQTPTNDLLRVSSALRFEQAQHSMFTYQRTHDEKTLRAEAYYKTYDHLTVFDPQRTTEASAYRSTCTGYARGLDLYWRDRKSLKNTDYWISYGFLDTRRQSRQDPVSAVPTFAARHNLSLVGKYWVAKLHTQIGFTASYGSPRTYHNPNQEGYNQGRLPSYQDLSLNASYLTTIGKQFTIIYVSVSNVLGRDNVFGYRFADTAAPDGSFGRAAVTPSAPRMLFVGVFVSINKNKKADLNTAPD